MGCAPSKPENPEDREAMKQNASIDKMLRMDKKNYDRTVKILLLGECDPSSQPIIQHNFHPGCL